LLVSMVNSYLNTSFSVLELIFENNWKRLKKNNFEFWK
jgi:hypothetical protein